jgi:tetratricopeptide (TPR) repeat protein
LTDYSKSQLALQYAHSIRDASPQTFVFWVHASTQARFEEAYRDIADLLELPGRNDVKVNVLRLVSDWLRDEANGRWVMVIDNVDNVKTFFPSRKRQRDEADASAQIPLATYIPQSRNGTILVTSRSKDAAVRLAGGYNKTKEVLAMDEGEGLQLLHHKLHDPPIKESAVELLRALDCIPLAITQAAAYINRRARMTVNSYLNEFRRSNKKRESLLNWDADELHRDKSASNSVVTTWQMSFEQIRQERPSAGDLLSLMSFFNPQGIPESTLRKYSKGAAGAASAEDEEEADSAFNEDLDSLRAYSLVSTRATSDVCEMHALVQFCTRVWLASFSDAEQWEQRFLVLMAQELPEGKYENWGKCQQLLPHVEPLFDADPTAEEALKAWAQVLTNAAWYLWLKGSYKTAHAVASKALTARETVYGLDNNQTLTSVSVLALVLQYQGKYDKAEKLNWRALEGREKELGVHHPATLTSVSNLAMVLRYQGKYDEAEKLNRRALEGRKKELGVQ